MTTQPDGADAVTPAEALAGVRARIAAAARRAGRAPEEVTLVGVSKTVPLERVVAMAEAGLEDLGENHAVEMHRKADALPNVRWHFLGKLQRGTVRHVAEVASVVHSAEPGDALDALARRAEGAGRRSTCWRRSTSPGNARASIRPSWRRSWNGCTGWRGCVPSG